MLFLAVCIVCLLYLGGFELFISACYGAAVLMGVGSIFGLWYVYLVDSTYAVDTAASWGAIIGFCGEYVLRALRKSDTVQWS